jgi:hypothetical protein
LTGKEGISPRNEALSTILNVRASLPQPLIGVDDWADLVDIAWSARASVGDRRDIQRAVRDVLLRAAKAGGHANP